MNTDLITAIISTTLLILAAIGVIGMEKDKRWMEILGFVPVAIFVVLYLVFGFIVMWIKAFT
jgi:glucan phosphoethanolaminetransferase (alkaline phosphatase superfamily)